MSAWFDKNYSELNEADFNIVYAEYQDSSGLFLTEDFEKQGIINTISQRINYIKVFIRCQREFMSDFSFPFIRDFENLKEKYGYVLKWKNDVDEFEKQLQKIEKREIKHHSILEEKIKELNQSRKNNQKQIKPKDDEDKSRSSFIRMLNSLGKIGYKFERKTSTVEDLSLMIKQQLEEAEEINIKYGR